VAPPADAPGDRIGDLSLVGRPVALARLKIAVSVSGIRRTRAITLSAS